MVITEVQRNYGTELENGIETSVKGVQKENKKETDTNRTTKEYSDYLTEKYGGILKAKDNSVTIAPNLLAKAATDAKTAHWLEYNLNLIPDVIDKINENAARNGSRVLSCNISFDGYDSMTTQVHTVSEADPGTEEAKKLLDEVRSKNKERREAQEKLVEKNKEKKQAEEKMKQTYTKTFVTDGVESLGSRVNAITFYDEPNAISIDLRG